MMHSLLAAPLLILAQTNPLEHVMDKPILRTPGGFWIFSNNVLSLCISALAMLLIFPWITREYREGKHVPTGTRNFFEAMLVYIREQMIRPLLGEQTDRYLPFLWTLFFFILFNNLLGLLPLDAITGWLPGVTHGRLHPIGGTATANIWVTGALALVAFVMWQYNGIRTNGLVPYLKHFTAGAPLWLAPMMVPLEIVGSFIKPFALAVRLFANMIAGHTVLAVLLMFTTMAFGAGAAFGWGVSIVVVLAAVAMMFLELFVAFLQTYIFVFLTAMFIGQLVAHHHDEHADGHAHGGEISDAARQAGTHLVA